MCVRARARVCVCVCVCVNPCLPRDMSVHMSFLPVFSAISQQIAGANCRGTQHLCPTVCNEAMGASGKGRQTCLPVPANWVEYLGNVKLQLVSTQWGIWAVLSAAGDHKE